MKGPVFSLFSFLIGLVLTLAVAACLAAHAAEPANPSATPQVRTILNYFHELSARKEGRQASVSPIGIGDADRCGIADRPGESEKLHMVVPE